MTTANLMRITIVEVKNERKKGMEMIKLSTINQIIEGILEELGEKSNGRMIANEAVIYYKTAMICENHGIEEAMKYFTGTHDEDEYQEFRTSVVRGEE